jgi:hypothetical protein
MKSRNPLFAALALGLTLSAPMAFAQDAQSQSAQAAEAATPATPADPASQSTDATAATPATPASPAASPTAPGQDAKKITWSDLDADKDGKLTKDEASSVQALAQVFDDADTDQDGALTPEEYKAYVAKNQADAAKAQSGG